MRVPYKFNGLELFSSVSIGINYINDEINIFDGVKQASLAMYQAKSSGKNNVKVFDNILEKVVLHKTKLETHLRNAIAVNELELYYQPQINVQNKIFGCEALLRWQNKEMGGNVSPASFIPVAEETALILPIGQWVLETACKTLDKWHESKPFEDIVLSVNISAIQFKNSNFMASLEKALSSSKFNRTKLKLELTETMLANDVEHVVAVMQQVKKLGLTISLDDFGTGYSSLAYLKNFPIDQLKIDRAFVKDILIDRNEASIAEAIIKLSQTLGLETIAEGVETLEQRDYLTQLGCEQFQGFLYSKALSLGDVEQYIKEFNK